MKFNILIIYVSLLIVTLSSVTCAEETVADAASGKKKEHNFPEVEEADPNEYGVYVPVNDTDGNIKYKWFKLPPIELYQNSN